MNKTLLKFLVSMFDDDFQSFLTINNKYIELHTRQFSNSHYYFQKITKSANRFKFQQLL